MKTEELRGYISQLFEKCEDKDTLTKFGVINQKIDEIEAETKAKDDEYKALLKDYKDVVIHQSYKPETKMADDISVFDADKTLSDILNNVVQNNK